MKSSANRYGIRCVLCALLCISACTWSLNTSAEESETGDIKIHLALPHVVFVGELVISRITIENNSNKPYQYLTLGRVQFAGPFRLEIDNKDNGVVLRMPFYHPPQKWEIEKYSSTVPPGETLT